MPDAYTDANFNILPNAEAIAAFNAKMVGSSFSYLDVLAHEHAVAFTVAKMMDADMLAETRDAISAALENGTDFRDFQKRLKPYLMSKGWWGEQVMSDPKDGSIQKVQLGSTRRLRTIYQTNLHTAYAAGQWDRIQQTKEALPYLQYMPSLATRKRRDHKQYYGIIRPVDDPIWQQILPPNGYGCLCWVKQLTRTQAERAGGVTEDKDIEYEEIKNPRTGKTERVPTGISLSFAHNHGDRIGSLLKIAEGKHGSDFAKQLQDEANKILARYNVPEIATAILPAAAQWQEAAAIGKEIYRKHAETFDAVDLDKEYAFSNALIEVMEREGVPTGALAKLGGDKTSEVQAILGRYPSSWVDKANEAGTTYVRELPTRAFHLYVDSDQTSNILKTQISRHKQLKVFAKFVDDIAPGDSFMKVGKMTKGKMDAASFDVAIHEYGHRLQAIMPELDAYFKQLWIDRTKGERTRPLALIQKERGEYPYYAPSEVGRRDNFANVYIGRNYGSDTDPKPLELITMTMQTILGSGQAQSLTIKHLLDNDPDMLYLAIALLTRYTP